MTAPIPLLLDLWSVGHSAKDVAGKLGVPRWKVYQTVAQAREIGDPRAVVHQTERGVLAGNPRVLRRVLLDQPDVELVPMVRKTHCKHGHAFTEDNTRHYRGTRFCRECHRADWHSRKKKVDK